MKPEYARLSIDDAQKAIYDVIVEVYMGKDPSKQIVDTILMDKFGIKLFDRGFNVSVKVVRGKKKVRCTFKAPAPDGKGIVGIWV
ncbi:hypothetical protein HYT05_01410 [Candidatus Kaiserbacteria bacterium]|nr:hypothetical protein [Candidatus Kaiserbacteria bacterium]